MLHEVFKHAGSLRGAYERVNWDATPLGPVDGWSPELVSTVKFALATRFPVTLLWGDEYVLLYNESYAAMIADKHPWALGQRGVDVFPEAWTDVHAMLVSVRNGDGSVWLQNLPMPLMRNGALTDRYFTFSYSPVYAADGAFAGVVDIATDTTEEVVSFRRLALLSQMGETAHQIVLPEDIVRVAVPLMKDSIPDLADVDVALPDVDSGPFWSGVPDELRERDVVVREVEDERIAYLRIPGTGGPTERPVLVVKLRALLPTTDDYLAFLSLIATSLGNAWSVAVLREREHQRVRSQLSMAESLQRNLLADPPQPDHLEIAARYVPATQQAQIGGDWYDAFVTAQGATFLVIGDVSGHDQRAAAVMAEVRNLLRGLAFSGELSPAMAMVQLDRAMRQLDVQGLATASVAQIDQSLPGDERVLRWTNAGHPAPLLIHSDGSTEILGTKPDLLLGIDPEFERSTHERKLEDGATVLFFTDGLIERRSASIETGMEWLATTAAALAHLPLEDFCDTILAEVAGYADDDIALLAVRMHPET